MNNFSGKTFLIAGASSGIGKNAAEHFTKNLGANVVLVARRMEIITELAQTLPGNNYAITYDFLDLEHIGDIFKECEQQKIYLDGIVYAAGIAPLYPLKENDTKLTIDTMKINTLAFAEIAKGVLTSSCMREQASVVAISSNTSFLTTNRQSAYSASKAALNTYVKYFAKEAMGKYRVNAILPAAVETEMYQKLREQSPNLDEKAKKDQPLGVIPPEKVSKTIEFLMSEDSSYMTGNLVFIGGGSL
jgi:Dehydrogenases with different specificities (related to short-chain alcohol dehydrogenases)